jgi:hypothetical protein
MKYLYKIVVNPKIIGALFLALAILASILSLYPKVKIFDGIEYTNYNNYVIFKQSFIHLMNHQDLYKLYPNEHWDLYKYSPTFALFFGFFQIFPDSIGLILWNILNAGVLLFSIYYLPKV